MFQGRKQMATLLTLNDGPDAYRVSHLRAHSLASK